MHPNIPHLQARQLILASQSPRRSQLLQEAGFVFTVNVTHADESFPDDLPPHQVAAFVAQRKAAAARSFITDDAIVVASDTTVIFQQQVFNKPADYAEAFLMIQQLQGNMHEVVTGVCLFSLEKEIIFTEISEVFFNPMSDAEIDFYIRNYQPYDKAGAYGIQEWIGLCKIAKINGTYANVMGLPVNRVYDALKEW